MKKVNFFLVGEPKCGTTILYHYFKNHKSLFLSDVKEPSYFCSDFFNEIESNKDSYSFRTLNDYHSLYDLKSNKKYLCDFSPGYLFSKVAAENIYKYNKKSKILVLLREPVSFFKKFP